MTISRSENMRRIQGKDTKPEMVVRSLLRSLGYPGYRLHRSDLPGKPDVAYIGRQKAIVINGCFWHGHDCELFRMPKTRSTFWQRKIEANRARDQMVSSQIGATKWRQCVVWECSVRGLGDGAVDNVGRRIADWLRSTSRELTIRGGKNGLN